MKGVTMINREDIKEGLKFRMPNDIIRRKYQVASFCVATDMCESIQYLTTLKTPHGDKNYVTPKVPLFEVCGGPKLISSADKNDPHCAWVGEYIKIRSVALGKKPLYICSQAVLTVDYIEKHTTEITLDDTDWQEMVDLHNTIAFERTKDHDWSAKVPDSLKERVNNFLSRDFYQKYNLKEGGL